MNSEEVLRLAKLARIEISDGEAETLSHEFDVILGYVGEIKNAKLKEFDPSKSNLDLKNEMREDRDPHESGVYTETILREVPSKEGDYVRVKKIL